MEEVRSINKKGQVVYTVVFNGEIYRRYPNGKHPNYYYHRRKENGVFNFKILHKEVYRFYFGEIPEGYVIHHKDFNPLNNDPSNLQLLSRSKHMEIHAAAKDMSSLGEKSRKNGFTKENWHDRRKVVMARMHNDSKLCEHCGKEFIATNTHQRFCSKKCHHKWQYDDPQNDIEFVCQYCGQPFKGNKYLKPKCCSEECAHKLSAYKRNQAKRRKNV